MKINLTTNVLVIFGQFSSLLCHIPIITINFLGITSFRVCSFEHLRQGIFFAKLIVMLTFNLVLCFYQIDHENQTCTSVLSVKHSARKGSLVCTRNHIILKEPEDITLDTD